VPRTPACIHEVVYPANLDHVPRMARALRWVVSNHITSACSCASEFANLAECCTMSPMRTYPLSDQSLYGSAGPRP
jgi:hypothetical protein